MILSQTDGTNTMYFQYDTSGTPLGFIIISAAIDIAITAFEPTGIIKLIGIAASTLFPLAVDLIARILINKENTA